MTRTLTSPLARSTARVTAPSSLTRRGDAALDDEPGRDQLLLQQRRHALLGQDGQHLELRGHAVLDVYDALERLGDADAVRAAHRRSSKPSAALTRASAPANNGSHGERARTVFCASS